MISNRNNLDTFLPDIVTVPVILEFWQKIDEQNMIIIYIKI